MALAQPRPAFADMAVLVRRLSEVLDAFGAPDAERQADPAGAAVLSARTGLRLQGGRPVVVVGRDVALELGHPATASETALLLTRTPGSVVDGRIRCYGPDFEAAASPGRPYGQVVIVAVQPTAAPDPFVLEQAQQLNNRLPGWMVRTVPGRLWVRVGAAALARGLCLLDVGEALVHRFRDLCPEVVAVETVLVTRSAAAVAALGAVAREARILAGEHKKLRLAPDGELECPDLDCDHCEEREVCDALRDVIVKRRRKR